MLVFVEGAAWQTMQMASGDTALDEAEAWALGQLVKCLGWADCRTKAVDDAEAHLMQEALAKLQRVLDEADISPR